MGRGQSLGAGKTAQVNLIKSIAACPGSGGNRFRFSKVVSWDSRDAKVSARGDRGVAGRDGLPYFVDKGVELKRSVKRSRSHDDNLESRNGMLR